MRLGAFYFVVNVTVNVPILVQVIGYEFTILEHLKRYPFFFQSRVLVPKTVRASQDWHLDLVRRVEETVGDFSQLRLEVLRRLD